jgi:hypothetical protein
VYSEYMGNQIHPTKIQHLFYSTMIFFWWAGKQLTLYIFFYRAGWSIPSAADKPNPLLMVPAIKTTVQR